MSLLLKLKTFFGGLFRSSSHASLHCLLHIYLHICSLFSEFFFLFSPLVNQMDSLLCSLDLCFLHTFCKENSNCISHSICISSLLQSETFFGGLFCCSPHASLHCLFHIYLHICRLFSEFLFLFSSLVNQLDRFLSSFDLSLFDSFVKVLFNRSLHSIFISSLLQSEAFFGGFFSCGSKTSLNCFFDTSLNVRLILVLFFFFLSSLVYQFNSFVSCLYLCFFDTLF